MDYKIEEQKVLEDKEDLVKEEDAWKVLNRMVDVAQTHKVIWHGNKGSE